MQSPNPLHQASDRKTARTTVNAAENIPGVMTPLGASMFMEAVELGLCGAFAALGVLRSAEVRVQPSPDDRFSGVFFGRLATNVDRLRWVSDITPGSSGDAFERQLLGTVRENMQPTSRRHRYPMVATLAPIVVARLPRAIHTQSIGYRAWWQSITRLGTTVPAAVLLEDAHDRAVRALRQQMLATFVAQGIFDRLSSLAQRAGCPDVALTLMTGYGATDETEMVALLYRVGHGEESLSEFLRLYGARCPGENELSAVSWREDPSPVEALANKYRQASTRIDPRSQHAARVVEREAAESAVLSGLSRASRPSAELLFKLGARYIPLREEGKAALAMAMDGARAAARTRVQELVASGHLESADDISYLTYQEIIDIPPVHARARGRSPRDTRGISELRTAAVVVGNPGTNRDRDGAGRARHSVGRYRRGRWRRRGIGACARGR